MASKGPDVQDGSGPEAEELESNPEVPSSLYNEAPIGLCYFDLDLRYVHVNDWLAAINGLAVSEHLGRIVGDVLPDVAQGVEQELRHVIMTGEPVDGGLVEAQTPAHPGIMKTFQHNFYPATSPDGTVAGVICTVQDVTERMTAERELARYESMVTASSVFMVFVDSTFTYRAVNQAYCDEHALTRDEILGRTVAEVMGEEVFERSLRPHFERCLAGEKVAFGLWWDSPTRGRRHIDARYDPFLEADGSASGVVVCAQDTTEQEEIEDRLNRSVAEFELANQELEAFSDALTHDLRSPLLIVTNFSHQLYEAIGASMEERYQDDLQRIASAGHHMMNLIDDLRDLADANRSEISRTEIDLSALGRGIIDDFKRLVPDREVRFEVEPGIKAHGDTTLVRILLTNLLQNAWKYTQPKDDAWIELGVVEDEDDGLIYHVRDNGIGFAEADVEVIFQAFQRLHTRAEFPGSGLGLATVERIVRRHGGRVWAEGVLGQGAIFRFTLRSSGTEPPEGERRRRER